MVTGEGQGRISLCYLMDDHLYCGLHGEMRLQVVDFDRVLDFDVLELHNRL